jgi:hypothetical protein
MNEDTNRRLHALLDGDPGAPPPTPEETAALDTYRRALARLEKARIAAPAGMEDRIMANLPRRRSLSLRQWLETLLPQGRQWALPSLAGALAMLLLMAGLWRLTPQPPTDRVVVHFQLHAPGAARVELVGDFNNWTPGVIRLHGPDASGHWTTSVELPEGHYEYQFLVNGKTWVTDPAAPTHRPDGFGRENAILDVYEERS